MDQKIKNIAAGVFVLLLLAGAVYLFTETGKPVKAESVMGVTVYSAIPLEEFQNKTTVGLLAPAGKAETTCTFEIRGASNLDTKGYMIHLERKPMGLYLEQNDAYIRGESDDDLLQACHAFMCLRDNISCDSSLMLLKNITLRNNDMIIVIDNRTGGKAGQGYSELLGALGFLQAQRVDTNNDGQINSSEMNKSKIHIYPYIQYGDNCQLQQFKNVLQTFNITNDTVSCDLINNGIFLTPSKMNQITIDGRKIMIEGDDAHIHTGAMIVRDILSPEFIRAYYHLS
jgi:hypothetical protein